MTRKKKRDESVQEYTLVMREIDSRSNVINEDIIPYIIDGILDNHNQTKNQKVAIIM